MHKAVYVCNKWVTLTSHCLGCGTRNIDCQIDDGKDYEGTVSNVRTGAACINWKEQKAHPAYATEGDHNHCRNPGPPGTEGVWCYIGNTDTDWEYCEVRKCYECDRGEH